MLTIRRRGDIWHCRGTIRMGTETRIVKEHSTGCREREAAEAYKAKLDREIRQEILHGTAGRDRVNTVADALALYLHRPGGLHSMDVWRIGELNKLIGDYSIASVKDGWNRFKRERCAGLAPSTVDRFRATLVAALNYACDQWEIDPPRIRRDRYDNERMRFLTKQEQEALLAAYAKHVRPIGLTLCFQGSRTQEALQLTWRDIDLDRGTMFFSRTKTGKPRTVQMHPRVHEAISLLWKQREKPFTGHVFLNRLGEPYADTRDYKYPGGNPLRKAHETACTRAKITDFRVHDWRHHWASWCVMSGIDLETIMRMGGWQTLRMVERYAAVSTEHMAAAVLKFQAGGGQ